MSTHAIDETVEHLYYVAAPLTEPPAGDAAAPARPSGRSAPRAPGAAPVSARQQQRNRRLLLALARLLAERSR